MDSSKGLVSIIMPVYNTVAYLGDSIRSCLAQTYRNVELVVVDDGSTDGSLDLLRKLAASDGRIVIISTPNGGVVVARNLAIANARGEYLYFLDSDDSLLPDAIERLVSSANKNSVDMVLAGLIVQNGQHRSELYHTIATDCSCMSILREMLLYKFPGSLYPILFRRELFDDIAVPADMRIGEDFYAVCQIMLKHNPKYVVDHTASHIYIQSREGSVMNTKNSEMAMQQIVLSKNVETLMQSNETLYADLAREIAYFHLHNLLVYADKCDENPDRAIVTDFISRFYDVAGEYVGLGMRLKLKALRFNYRAYRLVRLVLSY